MKHKILALLSMAALSGGAFSQNVHLNPQPQEIRSGQEEIALPASFRLVGAEDANPKAVARLQTLLGNKIQKQGLPVYIGEKNDKAMRKFKKMIPDKAEGYYLAVNGSGIVLAGSDERGTFYAVQTLKQLLTGGLPSDSLRNRLPETEIKDYPDIRFRGVVEGFYGTPWRHEDRMRQLRFYGENKLNTYIYGPKDDPYHSTPHWRLPYPDKEAGELKKLIETAHENEVDFVWAIHPGQDIQWNDADREKVIEKFERMYQLGARSFAIFFDDISGDGTDANRQAELLNYIDRKFVKEKKDVTPLIMCPTEYNRSWSNPKGNYLTTLGTKLHPDIQIMWTGDRVIADMTREGLNWINERIRRPAYIWWNFPVSDYVRDHLLMGAVYGNEKGIEKEMSGFVSNPMERAEASKIALYGVAAYAWNMETFDSQQSWEKGIAALLPDAADALLTFCKHNSDLGPNGHGYRRVESVEIQPFAERFAQAVSAGKETDIDDLIRLKAEFEKISESADILLASESNPTLIDEIKPWLYRFRLLGSMGNEALYLQEALKHRQREVFERKYAHLKSLQKLSYEIDQSYNQNPYQPGVKTGSKVLTPFIDTLFAAATRQFNHAYGTQLSVTTLYSPHKLTSDIGQLRNQPLQTKNNTVLISPLLEVLKWPAGKFVEIEFDRTYAAFELDIHFGKKELPSWGKCEVTADGKTWEEVEVSKGVKNKAVKAIRFYNAGDKEEQIHFRKFAVTLRK
ncbi:beta-N-acetylglucosaminidase [Bacteroides pyogenes]|uniref:beta-N-acetylglucosaminidase n=1 Tax=Bacteroides pyogenes TaxID=310300 RepID=UPI001F398E7A|nr:beta-N-acetylglucosaminidase [Bacteroides pyogenes]MCE9107517.1 beta-N-acetylglucosaminidase domain-containing protein [Bacteroides pyogenes]